MTDGHTHDGAGGHWSSTDLAVAAGLIAAIHAGILAQLLAVDAIRLFGGVVGRTDLVWGWLTILAFGAGAGLLFVSSLSVVRETIERLHALTCFVDDDGTVHGRLPRIPHTMVTYGLVGVGFGFALASVFLTTTLATVAIVDAAVPPSWVALAVTTGCVAFGVLVGGSYGTLVRNDETLLSQIRRQLDDVPDRLQEVSGGLEEVPGSLEEVPNQLYQVSYESDDRADADADQHVGGDEAGDGGGDGQQFDEGFALEHGRDQSDDV